MTGSAPTCLALVALLAAGAGCVPETSSSRIPDYLRPDVSDTLRLEVDAVEGLAPRADPLDEVLGELASVVHKPGGVSAASDDVIEGKSEWTLDDLQELEAMANDAPGVVHVLWLDGRLAAADDAETLGLAWGHQHVAIFAETLERTCRENGGDPLTGLGAIERACGETERAVLLHEIGHVLGLVNDGLPMVRGHEDADHSGHDAESSVMSWGYDGPDIVFRLRGAAQDAPPTFGPASLEDIAAVRDAKEPPLL